MEMHRFPPDEHFNNARHKAELTQASRLRAALDLGNGTLEGWRWPIFSREITYEHKSRDRMTEIDALLWVPDLGFVVLDFKTADRHLRSDRDIDYLFDKSWMQATALREAADWYNKQYGLEEKGFATPRVLPLVGFLKGPNKKETETWEKSRARRRKPHVPGVGTQLWEDGKPEELAQYLQRLVIREMENTGRHTTVKKEGKPWGLAEATEWWKTFEGRTRPARHFKEHLDSALSLSDTRTMLGTELNWGNISRQLSNEGALAIIPSAGQAAGGPDHDRIISAGVVRGLAGTGKTWLAWWAGARLASQGRRALLLCRSERLAEELGRDTKAWLDERDDDEEKQRIGEGLDIKSLQSLFGADADSQHRHFQLSNAEHWRELTAKHAGVYDAVLVDEAQDFGTLSNGRTAFDYLSGLLRVPTSGSSEEGEEAVYPILLLFGDSGQNTAESELGAAWVPPEGFVELMDLRTNLRSTKAIVKEVNDLVGAGYDWPESMLRGYEPEVQFKYLPAPEPRAIWKVVKKELESIPHRLGHNNPGNPFPKDIANRVAIVVDDPDVLTYLVEQSQQSSEGLSQQARLGLTFATIDDFKGSERDIVLCVLTRAYEDVQSLRAIAYTGMSRGRGDLVVIHSQERLA